MALSSETSKTIFVCTGGTVYAVPFYFLQNADLTVYREDADGAVSTLTITTDYTVTGAGSESGGELTTIATYSDGKLIVVRDVDYTQRLDLIQGDGFRPDTLEQELDRIVMQVQQLARKVGVSLQLPDSDTSGVSAELPSPEAGKVFAWNATGDAIVNEVPQYTVLENGSVVEEKLGAGAVTLSKIDADASTDTKGLTRLATDSEAVSESSSAVAVTPSGLGANLDPFRECFVKYISGLVVNCGADIKHDIDISNGSCRDESNAGFLTLSADITKQIDAAWAEGTNAGGFPSGISIAPSTWYNVFLIKDVNNGTVDAGFDTSPTASNLLSDATGYTLYRRIGSVRTDSSSNITRFTAVEAYGGVDYIFYDPPLDVNVATLGTAGSLYPLSVPSGFRVKAKITCSLYNSSTWVGLYVNSASASAGTPSQTASPLGVLRVFSSSDGNVGLACLECWTDTSGKIFASAWANSTTLRVATLGWHDPRTN